MEFSIFVIVMAVHAFGGVCLSFLGLLMLRDALENIRHTGCMYDISWREKKAQNPALPPEETKR